MGFSLVELMIVLAIMAILAAIAIPSVLRCQVKARESEARTNLATIKTCEESYKSVHGVYLQCTASPDALASPPGTAAMAWTDNGGFDDIGFTPGGMVRYCYEVVVSEDGQAFRASAWGDVDEDSRPGKFETTGSAVRKTNEDH